MENLTSKSTRPAPCISESYIKIKIQVKSFFFYTLLSCRKRFHEAYKGLHKTFWGTAKKCENNNSSYFWF